MNSFEFLRLGKHLAFHWIYVFQR